MTLVIALYTRNINSTSKLGSKNKFLFYLKNVRLLTSTTSVFAFQMGYMLCILSCHFC